MSSRNKASRLAARNQPCDSVRCFVHSTGKLGLERQEKKSRYGAQNRSCNSRRHPLGPAICVAFLVLAALPSVVSGNRDLAERLAGRSLRPAKSSVNTRRRRLGGNSILRGTENKKFFSGDEDLHVGQGYTPGCWNKHFFPAKSMSSPKHPQSNVEKAEQAMALVDDISGKIRYDMGNYRVKNVGSYGSNSNKQKSAGPVVHKCTRNEIRSPRPVQPSNKTQKVDFSWAALKAALLKERGKFGNRIPLNK